MSFHSTDYLQVSKFKFSSCQQEHAIHYSTLHFTATISIMPCVFNILKNYLTVGEYNIKEKYYGGRIFRKYSLKYIITKPDSCLSVVNDKDSSKYCIYMQI